jgi:hypothetical protein
VPGPETLAYLTIPRAAAGLPAYVGLGPGQEFIPYFLALLAWAGAALFAILQWPVAALLRRLRKARAAPPDGPAAVPAPPGPAPEPEASRNAP